MYKKVTTPAGIKLYKKRIVLPESESKQLEPVHPLAPEFGAILSLGSKISGWKV
tara:strand:+ start:215 stop:376 length:162 start_codon:yes stop_codon:yes gene_type:complete